MERTAAARVDVHWQPTFADLGTPLSEVTFVVVDLETTGTHAHDSAITEIGAVKVRGGEVLGEFQSLVNAGRPVPAFIARLTGITQAMVSTAPDIDLVLPTFLEWAQGSVLVAHNAPFDVGFLKAACTERGYAWPGFPVVDTLPLARRVVTKDEARDHKLGTLARVFHAEVDPNHRALADARATVDVLHGLFGRLGSLGVTHLEDLASAGDPVPTEVRRKAGLADGVPEAPGVYQFIGPKDEVLYIGTSNNLRKRVRTYFTAAEKRKQITEMVRIAERVNTIVCATPLEAAVRELRLITQHSPRYNRRSKHGDKVYWLRLTDEAYPRLTVSRTLPPPPAGGSSVEEGTARLETTDSFSKVAVIGPFSSQSSANEAMLAIQQAIPVRQCSHKLSANPRAPMTPCALGGMGRCCAPCEGGGVADSAYADAVAAVREVLAGDPSLVINAHAAKVAEFVAAEQFEAAAVATSRLKAFLGAAAKAQRLLPLAMCPELVAARPFAVSSVEENPGSSRNHAWELIIVRYGKLAGVSVCRMPDDFASQLKSLRATAEYVAPATPPMPSCLPEESHLILNWLESPGVRLIHAETPWALPVKSALSHVDLSEVSAAVSNVYQNNTLSESAAQPQALAA